MYNSSSLQQLFISLAVLTSMGTLVQDSRVNKALEVALPLSNVSVNISSNLDSLSSATQHTHVEQASVAQDFAGIPRIQVRDDHRRYVLPKYTSRTNGYFGDSQILWPHI